MIKEVLIMLILLIPFVNAKCNGVVICGQNYECGAKDNVDPASFGVECNCRDPDAINPLTKVVNAYVKFFKSYWGGI